MAMCSNIVTVCITLEDPPNILYVNLFCSAAAEQLAAVQLALRHGSVPSHGLGVLLDACTSQNTASQLSLDAREALLGGLSDLLRALPEEARPALLRVLCTLCSSDEEHRSELSEYFWNKII